MKEPAGRARCRSLRRRPRREEGAEKLQPAAGKFPAARHGQKAGSSPYWRFAPVGEPAFAGSRKEAPPRLLKRCPSSARHLRLFCLPFQRGCIPFPPMGAAARRRKRSTRPRRLPRTGAQARADKFFRGTIKTRRKGAANPLAACFFCCTLYGMRPDGRKAGDRQAPLTPFSVPWPEPGGGAAYRPIPGPGRS